MNEDAWAKSLGDVRLSWNTLDPSNLQAQMNVGAFIREIRGHSNFGGDGGGTGNLVILIEVEQAKVIKVGLVSYCPIPSQSMDCSG